MALANRALAREQLRRLGLLNVRIGDEDLDAYLSKLAARLIPPPSGEVEVVTPEGIKLALPPGLPVARTYAFGAYEKETTTLFKRLVGEGMDVVDGGAFVGYFSLLAAKLTGPSGRVYAFEPDPIAYQFLCRNVEMNGSSNVATLPQALAERAGHLPFCSIRGGGSRLDPLSTSSKRGNALVVEAVSLDAFFARLGWPKVDLIKLDIEGGELAALEGMRNLVLRNAGLQLILEFSERNMRLASTTPAALSALLLDMGFESGQVIDKGVVAVDLRSGLQRLPPRANLLLRRSG